MLSLFILLFFLPFFPFIVDVIITITIIINLFSSIFYVVSVVVSRWKGRSSLVECIHAYGYLVSYYNQGEGGREGSDMVAMVVVGGGAQGDGDG